MSKVKKTWSRRKRALFRIVFLVPLVILLLFVKRYGFTPGHALREMEERLGCGPTEVIRELGELPIGDRGREMFLAANDNALVLGSRKFDLGDGWQTDSRAAVDCSRGEPVAARTCEMDILERDAYREGDHKQTMVWFYGRVDDPDIQEVEVGLVKYEPNGTDVVEETWVKTLAQGEWLCAGGRYYFVTSWQTEGPYREAENIRVTLRTRNSAGEWAERDFLGETYTRFH